MITWSRVASASSEREVGAEVWGRSRDSRGVGDEAEDDVDAGDERRAAELEQRPRQPPLSLTPCPLVDLVRLGRAQSCGSSSRRANSANSSWFSPIWCT